MKTTLFETFGGSNVTLKRECPFCHEVHECIVDAKEYEAGMDKYMNGICVQEAFPSFTSSQREMIITGICDKCWKSI